MGGMQDEGSYMLPTQSRHGGVSYPDAEFILFDDGGKMIADPVDWTTVYALGRGANMIRYDVMQASTKKQLGPIRSLGRPGFSSYDDPASYQAYMKSTPRLRASWTAPLIISNWNSRTLYFGANYLLKSVDRGDHWKIISPDLSHDKLDCQIPNPTYYETPGRSGDAVYQTIRTLSESPLKEGMIWAGTDDGNVQLTMDDGAHWRNVTKNIRGLPEYTWVSRIDASRYSEGRAYITFDGHRNADLTTYVYVTEDYGKNWKSITGNLPRTEPCYVVKEGLKNPDLLLLGTEFSLWVSLDRGKSWSRYQNWSLSNDNKGYFPTVAIYDLEIQPRELDLIIGTHGRSIWTLPIRALEELTAENLRKEVYFVSPGNLYLFPLSDPNVLIRMQSLPGGISRNTQPGTFFSYYLRQDAKTNARIVVTDPSGQEVYASLTGPANAGLNVVPWGIGAPRASMPIHRPGDYRVTLSVDGREFTRTLQVEDVTNEDFETAPPPTYSPNDIYRPPTKR